MEGTSLRITSAHRRHYVNFFVIVIIIWRYARNYVSIHCRVTESGYHPVPTKQQLLLVVVGRVRQLQLNDSGVIVV